MPLNLRWGSKMKEMPADCMRSASSWNCSTDRAMPKWGTGTGSPSTAPVAAVAHSRMSNICVQEYCP